jgi:cell division protein FtsI/penicillin-binding protein 2
MTVLSLRLVDLQLIRHTELKQAAMANHTFKKIVKARRGDILDNKGGILATSVPQKDIWADLVKMRQIIERDVRRLSKNPSATGYTSTEQIVNQLAPILNLDKNWLSERMRSPRALVSIAHGVSLEQWERIALLNLPGIEGVDSYRRFYPLRGSAAQVIGFVDGAHVGRSGIEATFDDYLRSVDGWVVAMRDARAREIRAYREEDVAAHDGFNVVLTIDPTIQHIVEEELGRVWHLHQARSAYGIVMRPSDGAILAMANIPTYDPNNTANINWSYARNRCITDTFEPGSTFKIVTLASGIEHSVVELETKIFCENGLFYYAGYPLRDVGQHGWLTAQQIMEKSSNIGFAKIALELGNKRLYDAVRSFGFGMPQLDGMLPGEAAGTLRPINRWSKISITRIPIGHEVSATPLQMISAMSVIANNGIRMRPLIVREIQDSRGRAVARYAPRIVSQPIKPSTARLLTESLIGVTQNGTARLAQVPGFTVAGKTGTANKWDNEKKEYSKTKYLSSFIGFMPAKNPAFALLVVIDEPQGESFYGGRVAAPVFASIAVRIAKHMDLTPELPTPDQPPTELALR